MPSKKIVLVAVLVGTAMACVFGWARFWSYVRASRVVLNEFVGENVPVELERTRIATLIEDEERRAEAFEDRIAEIKARRAAVAETERAAKEEVENDKALLGRIKSMLDEGRAEYLIGARSYTHAEVNSDALLRAANLEQRADAHAANTRLIADLDAAIQGGRGSLAEARQRLGSLRVALAALDARDAGAEARLQARAIVNAIQCSPLGSNSELEAAMNALKIRVERKERRASTDRGGSAGRIEWNGTIASRSGSEEIARVLRAIDGSPDVPSPTTPATSEDRQAPGGGESTEAGHVASRVAGPSAE